MTDTIKNKTGRPSIFDNRAKLADALRGVKGVEGYSEPSRFIKLKLADAGYISITPGKSDGTRGRPAYVVKLTPRGHAAVNFAR